MARKNNNETDTLKKNRVISNTFSQMKGLLDRIYTSTYSNSNTDMDTSKKMMDDINKSLDNLTTSKYALNTVTNLSKLYDDQKSDTGGMFGNNTSLVNALNIFEDPLLQNSLMTSWMGNRWIVDRDNDVNLVLKYMPKLKEAMVCKRDLVMSADHFSKDFLSFHKSDGGTNSPLFSKRIEELKRVYKLAENYEDYYWDAQVYGETIVQIVPYSKELSKLMKSKTNSAFAGFNESSTLLEFTGESYYEEENSVEVNEALKDIFGENGKLTVSFNEGYISSETNKLDILREYTEMGTKSIKESFSILNEANRDAKVDYRHMKKLIPDDLEFNGDKDEFISSNDAIYDINKKEDTEIKVPGCIVKKLERENVMVLKVGDQILKYYYIEIKNNNTNLIDDINRRDIPSGMTGIANSSTTNMTNRRAIDGTQTRNLNVVASYVASQICKKIDKKFIEENQELRSQLYNILKHNQLFNSPTGGDVLGNINITAIDAEDIVHIKFNTDPLTQRGVSDLSYALFPAKLYSCMYITETIAHLTRGQDKRVYYIKNSVENNISKTMMNVLVQLKKGNFGARQMENLNNILNITGRYNDLIIPLSPDGNPPVQIENIPGQQFTDNSDFLTRLEKMAIDSTDIPYDLIEARQSLDYAIQATMTNSKVMRYTYKRQDMAEMFFSQITTMIYNYEYMDNEQIELTLPIPCFLNYNNGSQLIQGTIEFIDKLIETNYMNESDEFKNMFRKRAFRYYLPSHINVNEIDKLAEESRLELANTRPEQTEE